MATKLPSIDDQYFEFSACPLCQAAPTLFQTITASGESFSHERAMLCSRCGLVFLNPRMTDDALEEYYLSDTFSKDLRGGSAPDAEAIAYRDMRALRRWRFLETSMPKKASCLEIGCSSGNFLSILRQANYNVTGIDPSTGYAQYAKSQGLNVFVGNFPHDLPGDTRYEVIAMFHVLEHVQHPLEMLRAIRERLTDDGYFILEYPDIGLAAKRFFLAPTYFQKSHLYDFTQETINALLAMAGFSVQQVFYEEKTPPYDRNVLLIARPVPVQATIEWQEDRARRLHHSLLRKIRRYNRLLVFRPLWKVYKKVTK